MVVVVVVDAVVLPRTIFLPPVITISSLSHINCLITTQAALLPGNKSQYCGGGGGGWYNYKTNIPVVM